MPDFVPIIAVTAILLPLFIVLAVLHYRHKRDSQLHATVIQLAEKGVPIPQELLVPPSEPKSRLYSALTMTGLGIGLIVFFLSSDGNWGIGAIPLAIGLAQLVSWRVERKENGAENAAGQA